jgi:hypothetical protein
MGTAEQTEQYETSRYEGKDNSFNTIQLRLDQKDPLFELEKYFLRVKRDYDNEVYIKGAPMFDEEGIYDLLGELKRLSTSNILGNLPEERLKIIIKDTGEAVREFIYENEGRYNIPEDLWVRIYYQCVNQVEMGLRRSVNGFESRQLTEGSTIREIVDNKKHIREGSEQSSGFMSGFRGRR